MRSEDLYRSMSGIDDAILKRCIQPIKKRRHIHYKAWIAVAACAVLVLCGAIYEPWNGVGESESENYTSGNDANDGDVTEVVQSDTRVLNNFFVLTAKAAELSEEEMDQAVSGNVVGLTSESSVMGMCGAYVFNRFYLSGANIEKVKLSVDKNELYSSKDIYENDADWVTEEEVSKCRSNPYTDEGYYNIIMDQKVMRESGHREWQYHYEYWHMEGSVYEADYNKNISYGFFVPDAIDYRNDDPCGYAWDVIDMTEGTILTIGVTYDDGEYEEHHYQVKVGKIALGDDLDGDMYSDRLERFLTPEEEASDYAPFEYGCLLEQID